jgi:hypothetical protein
MTVWQERGMKFTVTSGAGFTKAVDRHASARAALERVLALLARKRDDVRIYDEDGSRRTPAELCCSQLKRLQCCPDELELSF